MTETIAVLGLDGADYRLLNHWDCENMLLDNHSQIETFCHAREFPITREVWPTIATGQMPTEGTRRGSDWTGPLSLVDWAAKKIVPMRYRSRVGIHLRSGPGVYQSGGGDHVFGDGAVYNWPGITPSHNWNRNSYWLQMLHAGKIDTRDFWRSISATGGMGIGWLAAMSNVDLPIAGIHVHQLDSAGHVWCERPEEFRERYMEMDEMVGMLRKAVDELVIVSDHGMQTEALDDEIPGEHSFRATISSTIPGRLPSHVKEVRDWLENLKPDVENELIGSDIDAPEERLRDMGYI